MKYKITCEISVPTVKNTHLDIPVISKTYVKKALYTLNKTWNLHLKNINVENCRQLKKNHGKT